MNDDQSGLPQPSKYIEAHLSLDSSRVTLRSPFVTFLDVVGFISLKSF